MDIRFYNARICTMEPGAGITRGELWVRGNRITYVGPPPPAADVSFDREVDVVGNLLMPGFKNAHTHSPMTFLRSYADDLPLLDWLEQQVFPMEAKLAGDDIYHLAKLAIMEYLTSGITSNFDMYKQPELVAKSSIDCGFRTVLCGCVNDFVSSVEEMEAHYLHFASHHELIGYRLGMHAEYTCSHALLEQIAVLSHKYSAPVFTHNSECKSEVEQCLARNAMTPTAYLDSLGLFDFGGGCFHCVHMTDEDLAILRKRRVSVVTNPGSNAKLASGTARVKDMLELGIGLAIGTDGPASNNCLDMFREMFLTTALQKLARDDASAMDADAVLRMATVGGAWAMGLRDCDCLTPGKLADLIIIDLQQPNMQPLNNLTKNLVYSGSKQNVKLTMVNGKILYEDGKFSIGTEPAEVYAKANEIIDRMR